MSFSLSKIEEILTWLKASVYFILIHCPFYQHWWQLNKLLLSSITAKVSLNEVLPRMAHFHNLNDSICYFLHSVRSSGEFGVTDHFRTTLFDRLSRLRGMPWQDLNIQRTSLFHLLMMILFLLLRFFLFFHNSDMRAFFHLWIHHHHFYHIALRLFSFATRLFWFL